MIPGFSHHLEKVMQIVNIQRMELTDFMEKNSLNNRLSSWPCLL